MLSRENVTSSRATPFIFVNCLVPAQDPPLGRRRGNIERWTGESWLGSSHAGNPHMEVTECPSKWPFQFEYEFGVRLFRRGFVKAVLRPPAAERVPHHAMAEHNLGVYLAAVGRTEEAQRYFDSARDLGLWDRDGPYKGGQA